MVTKFLVFFDLERNLFRNLIFYNKENDFLLFLILVNLGGWCYSSHKPSLLWLHWQSSSCPNNQKLVTLHIDPPVQLTKHALVTLDRSSACANHCQLCKQPKPKPTCQSAFYEGLALELAQMQMAPIEPGRLQMRPKNGSNAFSKGVETGARVKIENTCSASTLNWVIIFKC